MPHFSWCLSSFCIVDLVDGPVPQPCFSHNLKGRSIFRNAAESVTLQNGVRVQVLGPVASVFCSYYLVPHTLQRSPPPLPLPRLQSIDMTECTTWARKHTYTIHIPYSNTVFFSFPIASCLYTHVFVNMESKLEAESACSTVLSDMFFHERARHHSVFTLNQRLNAQCITPHLMRSSGPSVRLELGLPLFGGHGPRYTATLKHDLPFGPTTMLGREAVCASYGWGGMPGKYWWPEQCALVLNLWRTFTTDEMNGKKW